MATVYKIHNMSRSIETRSLRAASTAVRAPKKLLLGGGTVRVVRGRPATVTEAVLRRMQPELIKREGRGELKVTNAHGLRVDLTTLKPMEAPPVAPPKPNPPLDSAADDNKYPIGEDMPQHPGGAGRNENLEVPAVVGSSVPEGSEETEEMTEEAFDALVEAIKESATSKVLAGKAADRNLSTEGNKTDIATRLAEAGYEPGE
jgi:hypothetical protein